MPRVPFKICVTRLVGTSSFRASSAALISSASSSSAKCSPGWIAVGAIAMLLMIIDNLQVEWPRRSVGPLEANPPLIVNVDAVLALAVAYQRFKTVLGQRGEISQRPPRHILGDGKVQFTTPQVSTSSRPRPGECREFLNVSDRFKRVASDAAWERHANGWEQRK